jgi:hypothetical protein
LDELLLLLDDDELLLLDDDEEEPELDFFTKRPPPEVPFAARGWSCSKPAPPRPALVAALPGRYPPRRAAAIWDLLALRTSLMPIRFRPSRRALPAAVSTRRPFTVLTPGEVLPRVEPRAFCGDFRV